MLLALQQASLIQQELAALAKKHLPPVPAFSIRYSLLNGDVTLESPYTPQEKSDFLEIVQKVGTQQTPPVEAKAFYDCINPYLSERAITDKSRGEFESILRQYDTWCQSNKLDPWQRGTVAKYRIELQTRVQPKTLNKHMDRLNGLGTWAVRMEYIPKNPFDGLRVPLPKRKASEERPSLTHAEVEKLLASVDLSDHRHWWILLALYTGARPNELAQLHVTDIIEQDGIWCLSINDSQPGQRLKTIHSQRVIPVHKELIRRGFLKHVDKLRASGEVRLFPKWSLSNRSGAWHSGNLWYKKHRDAIGLEKDAHSIRHTFITALRDHRQPLDLISEIVGHQREGITANRYGKDSNAAILKPVIDALPVNPGRR
jgi:integrase